MIGATSCELEFEFAFTPDGQLERVECISIGANREHLVKWGDDRKLFELLPEALREKLIAEAWRDAEPEQDDWHAEDARMPGAAE